MACINIFVKNAAVTNQLVAATAIARSHVKLGKGIGSATFWRKKKNMGAIKMQLYNNEEPNGELGKFGEFDFKVVLEVLIRRQAAEFDLVLNDPKFKEEQNVARGEFSVYYAESLTKHYKNEEGKGPEIYIKREDMNHFGAISEVIIAKCMGRKRVLVAIRDGQLGITTAVACAKYGLDCTIFMASYDIERQSSSIRLINSLGAQVEPVEGNLAIASQAARVEWTMVTAEEWLRNWEKSSYLMRTVVEPHPGLDMATESQSMIGEETKKQDMEEWGGKLPDVVLGYIGSTSNALALFHELIHEEDVRLIGVEADSEWLEYQREEPKLRFLKETEKIEYQKVADSEAAEAYDLVVKLENKNIYPSKDDSYAFAYLHKLCPTLPDGYKVVVVI